MDAQVEAGEDKNASIVERWCIALDHAGKSQEKWEEKGKKIVERFRDEDRGNETSDEYSSNRRLNILWSNVETLKPAIFARLPKPVVKRRFQGQDPIGRAAAEVIEKALDYVVDSYDFYSVIESIVEDYLLPGRGMARPVYKPVYGEEENEFDDDDMPVLDENGEPKTFTPVVFEDCYCEYHFWRDIRIGPAKRWEQVPWVAWRHYMDRHEFSEKFGKDLASKPIFNHMPEGMEGNDKNQTMAQAEVWEIWSKKEKKVFWICKELDERPLKLGEPPINFKGFFNTPKPLFSIKTNDKMVPVPDFCQYQDQAQEIDDLTQRMDKLVKAIKVVGFYAGDEKATIAKALDEYNENVLIAVDDWAMFAERGGVEGMISWYPVDRVIQVLDKLFQAREAAKQELYEITGLSDILRGAGNPNETATAQRIKGQFATLRVSDRQSMVQRYVKDLIAMQAEIICEEFSLETIKEMTGLEYPEETWQQIYQLIQTDSLRRFRIDIETDSMIQVDEEAEKSSRIEFLTAAMQMLEKAAAIVQTMPDAAPLFGKMILFGVRAFRTGRELEEAFEEVIDKMSQPQQPDPQQQQLQQEQLQMLKAKMEAEIRNEMAQAEKNQTDADKNAAEAEQTRIQNQLGVV